MAVFWHWQTVGQRAECEKVSSLYWFSDFKSISPGWEHSHGLKLGILGDEQINVVGTEQSRQDTESVYPANVLIKNLGS